MFCVYHPRCPFLYFSVCAATFLSGENKRRGAIGIGPRKPALSAQVMKDDAARTRVCVLGARSCRVHANATRFRCSVAGIRARASPARRLARTAARCRKRSGAAARGRAGGMPASIARSGWVTRGLADSAFPPFLSVSLLSLLPFVSIRLAASLDLSIYPAWHTRVSSQRPCPCPRTTPIASIPRPLHTSSTHTSSIMSSSVTAHHAH